MCHTCALSRSHFTHLISLTAIFCVSLLVLLLSEFVFICHFDIFIFILFLFLPGWYNIYKIPFQGFCLSLPQPVDSDWTRLLFRSVWSRVGHPEIRVGRNSSHGVSAGFVLCSWRTSSEKALKPFKVERCVAWILHDLRMLHGKSRDEHVTWLSRATQILRGPCRSTTRSLFHMSGSVITWTSTVSHFSSTSHREYWTFTDSFSYFTTEEVCTQTCYF